MNRAATLTYIAGLFSSSFGSNEGPQKPVTRVRRYNSCHYFSQANEKRYLGLISDSTNHLEFCRSAANTGQKSVVLMNRILSSATRTRVHKFFSDLKLSVVQDKTRRRPYRNRNPASSQRNYTSVTAIHLPVGDWQDAFYWYEGAEQSYDN